METIERDYSPKGVKFYYVYKALAHPEYDGYVKPYTLEERLMHVKEAERRLDSRFEWVCDSMDNQLKHAMGGMPNSEVITDPQGRIVRQRAWSKPEELRKDLEQLVGKVGKPTTVAELKMNFLPPPKTVAKGVVPRVEVPGPMRPLLIEPGQSDKPYYVKLRAEAEPGFFDSGKGKLYVGFHLDPLYKVHWNNLAKPLEFEITVPEGVKVSPRKAKAKKVKQDADADPREFLLDLEAKNPDQPLGLTVRYYACDDADTFCVPVTQKYTVHLERDRDGGGAPGRWRPSRGAMIKRMMQSDANGDGRIARDEVPPRMGRAFDRIDDNGDGFIDQAEIESMVDSQDRTMRGGALGQPAEKPPV